MIDDEDRQVIGTGVLRLAALVLLFLVCAATAGGAVRLFLWTSGI